MKHTLHKIFLTDSLMDAHVLQALFESYGIPVYLISGNGLVLQSSEGLLGDMIKLFIPADRKAQADDIFLGRLGSRMEGPYTGSLVGLIQGKTTESRIVKDESGEEFLEWTMPDSEADEPIRSPEDQKIAPRRKCASCGAPAETDSDFCDQCGEPLRGAGVGAIIH